MTRFFPSPASPFVEVQRDPVSTRFVAWTRHREQATLLALGDRCEQKQKNGLLGCATLLIPGAGRLLNGF